MLSGGDLLFDVYDEEVRVWSCDAVTGYPTLRFWKFEYEDHDAAPRISFANQVEDWMICPTYKDYVSDSSEKAVSLDGDEHVLATSCIFFQELVTIK